MDLIFTKSETGKSWVAEFQVTANFNLHIERPDKGGLFLYQRTSGSKYDLVDDFNHQGALSVIDYDAPVLIPKFIKVVSEVEPTYAAVTSAGEVTEIKSQDKSVEVTANGTIDVTPDAGFAYLNKVSVKTNVAQSGEGGGSSKVRYFNIKPLMNMDLTQASGMLKLFPGLLAVKAEGKYLTSIAPMAAIGSEYYDEITSAAILDNFRGFIENTNDLNSSDIIPQMLQFGCTEITEEEFYNLDNGGGE